VPSAIQSSSSAADAALMPPRIYAGSLDNDTPVFDKEAADELALRGFAVAPLVPTPMEIDYFRRQEHRSVSPGSTYYLISCVGVPVRDDKGVWRCTPFAGTRLEGVVPPADVRSGIIEGSLRYLSPAEISQVFVYGSTGAGSPFAMRAAREAAEAWVRIQRFFRVWTNFFDATNTRKLPLPVLNLFELTRSYLARYANAVIKLDNLDTARLPSVASMPWASRELSVPVLAVTSPEAAAAVLADSRLQLLQLDELTRAAWASLCPRAALYREDRSLDVRRSVSEALEKCPPRTSMVDGMVTYVSNHLEGFGVAAMTALGLGLLTYLYRTRPRQLGRMD